QTELYDYSLKVVQQPMRARMCGFGDKDRRPITPPPCIQLIINSKATGEEVDISKLDVSFFALTVELWSVDETQNLSLVSMLPLSSNSGTTASSSQHGGGHSSYYSSVNGGSGPSGPSGTAAGTNSTGALANSHASTPTFIAPPIKNLIGSVVATAFKLHDAQSRLGVWFILQDLSVRTEGEFKLKASFQPVMVLNTGTAHVQATCFSAPFRVYIAKKFPGVIESTELSRCFAMQGIKIPIRKDQKSQNKSNDE
ncbi:velvet factor, partial [Dipodascopsis uninucleata]